MKFLRQPIGTVEFDCDVLAHFSSHKQLHPTTDEAGGILLGRLIVGTDDIVIDEATGPSHGDKRARFSFFRAKKPAQNAVIKAWYASDGTSNYLGEWHTHPEDDPSPSTTDLADWQRIMSQSQFEYDCLFFVIVGRKVIKVWQFCKTNGGPTRLELRPE